MYTKDDYLKSGGKEMFISNITNKPNFTKIETTRDTFYYINEHLCYDINGTKIVNDLLINYLILIIEEYNYKLSNELDKNKFIKNKLTEKYN